VTSSSYCAPCISDLALVREAVTSVAGTASCMAHAVLLTHDSDDPGRRRQRLDALKELASSKAETAEPAEQVKLELLVQEYGLAGAMDMGGPSRRGPQSPRQGTPSAPGEGRKSRRGRPPPGDRPQGDRPQSDRSNGGRRAEPGETSPVTPAPGPAGDRAPEAVPAAAEATSLAAQPQHETSPAAAAPAPESTTPAAPQPAPADVPPSSAPDA
jgi:hypothetical protein